METLKVRCSDECNFVVLNDIREITREDITDIIFSVLTDHILLCFPGFLFILVMLALISNLVNMKFYKIFESTMPFLMIISLYVLPAYSSIKLKGNSIGRKHFKLKVIYSGEDNKNFILREWSIHAIPYTLFILTGYKILILYIMIQCITVTIDKKHRILQDIILKSKIVAENEEYLLELK